jgi:hypothetical protein
MADSKREDRKTGTLAALQRRKGNSNWWSRRLAVRNACVLATSVLSREEKIPRRAAQLEQ